MTHEGFSDQEAKGGAAACKPTANNLLWKDILEISASAYMYFMYNQHTLRLLLGWYRGSRRKPLP